MDQEKNTENIPQPPVTGGFIYNVTINVNWPIHDAWLQWMINIHIPDVMASGCFKKQQVVRLLEIDETDGPTYAVQYYAQSKADYYRYIELYAQKMRQAVIDLWGKQCVTFRTLMQVVH